MIVSKVMCGDNAVVERGRAMSEEMLQLRKAYIEIGKLVQKYGYGQYNGILNMLMGQIECIDSDEKQDEKWEYLINGYKNIFMGRGGISDFIIYDKDKELTNKLNEKFNDEVRKVWEIVKKDILTN